jgi:hypothetical protein
MSVHIGASVIGSWRRGSGYSKVMMGTVQVWPPPPADPGKILTESDGFILTEDSGYILKET